MSPGVNRKKLRYARMHRVWQFSPCRFPLYTRPEFLPYSPVTDFMSSLRRRNT